MDEVAAGEFVGGEVLSAEDMVSEKADEQVWGSCIFFFWRIVMGVDSQGTLFVDVRISAIVSKTHALSIALTNLIVTSTGNAETYCS